MDAATEVLVEVGYAEAGVQAICSRAGVSQGALFRHFATREALMVAVGRDVARRTLESYRKAFESLRTSEPSIPLALRLAREHSRSRLNQAWYELLVAARTREPLRAALEPTLRAYYEGIVALAREAHPGLAARLGDDFPMVVRTVIALFDGENMQRFVLDGGLEEDARLKLLGDLASIVRRSPGSHRLQERTRGAVEAVGVPSVEAGKVSSRPSRKGPGPRSLRGNA
ncbi:MAG: TetR/AcrR family transcriptional regulator [Polyangiaceae bacterium]